MGVVCVNECVVVVSADEHVGVVCGSGVCEWSISILYY